MESEIGTQGKLELNSVTKKQNKRKMRADFCKFQQKERRV